MDKPILNFETFELPFFIETKDHLIQGVSDDENEEEEEDTRISWDDNWGRWEWISDGRIKGLEANYKEAARLILYELWKQWQLDLNDSENKSYVNFIEQFK